MRPPLKTETIEAVNRTLDALGDTVIERFTDEGIAPERVNISRTVDMRFAMQVHELAVDLPGA